MLACVTGAVGATAVFAWVAFAGRADPLAPEGLGGFYDAQARSWLHGHWNAPEQAFSFERFKIGGKFYAYFGPWPAVLRLQVVAFTNEFDGRLSRVSMLLAFAVLLGFSGRIAWQARNVVRGRGPIGWRSLVAAGGFVFVVGCGSSAMFTASRAWVYHEAILWGAAWSLAAFSFIIEYLLESHRSSLAWAGVTATLALLSRASVGFGPVVTLGLLLALRIAKRAAAWWTAHHDTRSSRISMTRWFGVSSQAADGSLGQVAVACAVPVVLYAYVNYAKFGTLFGNPYEKQDILAKNSVRRAALTATGNRLYGLEYAPTNLLEYLRPDGLGFRGTFPWVTFAPKHSLHGLAFDLSDAGASVTTTSLLLVVLAVIGVIAVIRAAHSRADEMGAPTQESVESSAVFRLPLIGAALAAASTTLVASHAFRYEADFLPLLVMASSVGLFCLGPLLSGRTRPVRTLAAGALLLMAAWSCWVMFGLALVYQREYSGFQSTAVRAAFFSFQLDVNDKLGLGLPRVRRGPKLTPTINARERTTNAPHGELFVVGRCDGLYIANSRDWEPIEERPSDQRRWRVTFGRPSLGSREPLWSTGTGPYAILWVRWVDARHVRFEYQWTGLPDTDIVGRKSLLVARGHRYTFDFRFDPVLHGLTISSAGKELFSGSAVTFDAAGPIKIGRQPDPELGAPKFDGSVQRVSLTPICDRLTRRK